MRNFLFTLIFTSTLLSCGSDKPSQNENTTENTIIEAEPAATDEKATKEDSSMPKGLTLIKGSDCSACHMEDQKLVGPSYKDVADKYREDDQASEQIIKNIIEGSKGVWGEIPMPGHPQHSKEDVSEMVEYILSLS